MWRSERRREEKRTLLVHARVSGAPAHSVSKHTAPHNDTNLQRGMLTCWPSVGTPPERCKPVVNHQLATRSTMG